MSSFDPKAVSWAKAIGLTQITPLAAEEIDRKGKNWPKVDALGELPVPLIKFKIALGDINERNDWRLNPKTSIKGGVDYLLFIDNYWKKERNKNLLAPLLEEDPYADIRAIVASYNFGSARVRRGILDSGNRWMDQKKLAGSRKYVNRILGYCHQFSLPKG